MGEEIVVEAPQCAEHVGTAAKSRSADPEYVAGIVVLPLVGFDPLEDTPPAKRIAQEVDKAPGSPCVLESRTVEPRNQLGRNDRHVGLTLQDAEDRLQPSPGCLDIGIEQQVIIRLDLRQSAVVTARKTVIPVEAHHGDGRELLRQHRQRPVRRTVVGDDDPDPGGSRGHDARQEAAQMFRAVPVEYDDFNDWHSCVCVSSGGATTSRARDARGSWLPNV